jgi:hypothetical protein
MIPRMTGVTQDHEREQLRAVKAAMAARGWNCRELAKRTGLAYGTVRNVLAGINRCWPSRFAINLVLGRDIFTRASSSRATTTPQLKKVRKLKQKKLKL